MGVLGYIRHFSNLRVSFLLSSWPTQVEFLDLDDLNAETRSSGNSMFLGSRECPTMFRGQTPKKFFKMLRSRDFQAKNDEKSKTGQQIDTKFPGLFLFIFCCLQRLHMQ